MQNNDSLPAFAIKELSSSAENEELYEAWQAKAKALEGTRRLGHTHIVQAKAIMTLGAKKYYIFEWAEGGNLRHLYEHVERSTLTAKLVGEIITQLLGLADALEALQSYGDERQRPYIHGYLKPENILVFEGNTQIGVWKITDLGLVRGRTRTDFRTSLYEPPEVLTSPEGLCDMWSMGCIVLELVVWLLYGTRAFHEFDHGLMSGPPGARGQYWVYNTKTYKFELHPVVLTCIGHIKQDEEFQGSRTAMLDLLSFVESKLLIIQLPPNRPSSDMIKAPESKSSAIYRATAAEFRHCLKEIYHRGTADSSYFLRGVKRDGLSGPSYDHLKYDNL